MSASEQQTEQVIVGRFGAPFGIKGWVHCQSFTTPPTNLKQYHPWQYQTREGRWIVVEEVTIKPHKAAFIAKLSTHATREYVAELRGLYIGVAADVLPEPDQDEVYWRDLVGCQVQNQQGVLGQVSHLLETGAHDVLVVTGERGEVLIPYEQNFVKQVDLATRTISVDWPDAWQD